MPPNPPRLMIRLRRLWSGSIQRRLTLGISVLLAAIMAVFVYDMVSRQDGFLQQQNQEEARALARTLAANSVSWVLASDLAGLQELIQTVRHYPELRYAMVLDKDGRVLAHTDADHVGRYANDAISRSLATTRMPQILIDSSSLIDIAVPVQEDGTYLGWARVGLGRDSVKASLRAITRYGAVYATVAIGLGMLLVVLMVRGLTHDLARLVGAARRIGAGERGVQSGLSRADELGELSNAFDAMATDLDGASQELRHSEATLKEAQRIAHVGNWELDLESNLLSWTEEAYRIFGIDPAAFGASYEAFLDVVHPDDRAFVDKAYTDSVKNRTPYDIVHRLLMKDGRVKFVNERCETSYDAAGRPLRSIGTTQDITERMRAENALVESNEMLRSLVENAPIRVFWKDRELRYLGCNTAFARDAGLERPDELIGKDDFQMSWREQAGLYRADDRQVMDTGTPKLGIEEPQTTPDGRTIWLRTSKVPLRDAAGKVIGLLGIYEDITERRHYEEKLRLANTVIENSATVLFRWRAAAGWPVEYVSENVQQFGYTAGELMSGAVPYSKLIHPDELTRVAAEVAQFTAAGAGQFAQEYRIVTRNGTVRWIDDRTTVERDAAGNIAHYRGVVTDITERRQAQSALERSERHFRKLIEGGSDAFFVIDQAGAVIYRSPTGVRLTGWSDAEIVGRSITDHVLPEDLPSARTVIAETIRNPDRTTRAEVRIRRKDGTVIAIEATGRNLLADPDVGGIVVTVHDITERKRLEDIARERMQRIEAQAQALGAVSASKAMTAGDVEQLAREITELACRAAGVERANIWLFNDAETELRCIDLYEATPARHSAGAALRQSEFENEFRALKDARYVDAHEPLTDPRTRGYVESYLKPLRITSMLDAVIQLPDRHLGLLCLEHVDHPHHWEHDEIAFACQLADKIALAITNRGRREAQLAELEQIRRAEEAHHAAAFYARSLIEASLDPLATISPGGKITDVNRMTEEVTGVERTALIGTDFADYFTEPEQARAGYRQVLAEGYVRDYPLTIRNRSGRTTDVLYNATLYRNEAGEPQGVFAAARDITEKKQAERTLHKVNRALKALSHGNTALIHATDEAQLLSEMCRVIVEIAGYRMAWVGYVEHDAEKTVRLAAQSGYAPDFTVQSGITWADSEHGQGPLGIAVRTGKLQVVQDVMTDVHFEPWRANAVRLGYGSVLVAPLVVGKQVIGALSINAEGAHAFDDAEIALLSELAADMAFGIATLRTRTANEQNAERLQHGMEATVGAIAATVEMRDPYTAGHQRRVAELATAIAREMGLAEDQVHGLRLAGVVHDLGKIHIPAEILSKPARLSRLEFELVKAHAEAGYDILKGIDFPWPIAQIVLQHHERLDGSGYPRGIKGGEILLETKILTVADVVEAMASHRPYRPSLGIDAALDEIAANAGKYYDPEVVRICIALFREKGFTFTGSATTA